MHLITLKITVTNPKWTLHQFSTHSVVIHSISEIFSTLKKPRKIIYLHHCIPLFHIILIGPRLTKLRIKWHIFTDWVRWMLIFVLIHIAETLQYDKIESNQLFFISKHRCINNVNSQLWSIKHLFTELCHSCLHCRYLYMSWTNNASVSALLIDCQPPPTATLMVINKERLMKMTLS